MSLKRRLRQLERNLSVADPAVQRALRAELDAIVEQAERSTCPIELEQLWGRMQTLHEQLPTPEPSAPIELPDDPEELQRRYDQLTD
jgi:hypothetical protein